MAKKGNTNYMFQKPGNANVDDALEAARNEMKVAIAAYDNHMKEIATVTLGETLILGKKFSEWLTPGTSTGGFPQMQIGTGRTHLAKNTIAAINMLRSIAAQKYQHLEWHRHLAWYDPRVDADGVLSEFINGEWRFSAYKNGVVVPAGWMGDFEFRNRCAKHSALDQLIQSIEFGSAFTLVFNRDVELALWQERIVDCLEKPLPEVWKMISEEYAEAKSRNTIMRGNNTVNNSVPHAADRLVVGGVDLAKVTKPHNVTYTLPSGASACILFDPSAPFAAKVLNNLATMAPNYHITKIEEAA